MLEYLKENELYQHSGINNQVVISELATAMKEHEFSAWIPNDASQFSELYSFDNKFLGLRYYQDESNIERFEKHLYKNYYPGLFYIFLEAQSKTMTYPGISWMELNKMISSCDIFNESFGEPEIDRIYRELLESEIGDPKVLNN